MKLVYTSYNTIIVNNVKNLLQTAGIGAEVRNLFAGGGAGELPLNEIWPEVWVDESDYPRAKALVDEMERSGGEEWRCPNCGEENGAAFEVCWNCGERDPSSEVAPQRGPTALVQAR